MMRHTLSLIGKLWIPALALVLGLSASPALAQGNRIGATIAVRGQAQAIGPNGTRNLQCGSPIFAGERIVTGSNSLAGLLLDGGYLQMAADTTVDLDSNDGSARADLLSGKARAVGEGAPQLELTSSGAGTQLESNDAEAFVLDEKAGKFAMFCDWDTPLAVNRGSENLEVDPGNCVMAKSSEPLYAELAHQERQPLGDFERCPLPDVAAGPIGENFAGTPGVDAGIAPVLAAFPDPTDPGGFNRDPCDTPGSGCAGGFLGPDGNLPLIDPPPVLNVCTPGVNCGLPLVDPAPVLNACLPGVACNNN